MTCDPRLLSYYRDGALSFEERYEVEDHLRECTDCTATLRGLMRLAQVVRSMPAVPVPATLRQDVYRLVAAQEQQRRRPVSFGGLGRALAPAAVAASIAVSALVVFRPGALDLANKPAAVSITAQAPAGGVTSGPSQVTSTAGSAAATSNVPKIAPGPADSRPSSTVPVVDPGLASVPAIKLPDPAAVPEPIARLYSANAQVRRLLGEPLPGSRTVTLLEQSFQGGQVISRSDTREIYVLRRDNNSWSIHPDTWRPGDSTTVDGAPPAGAMIPAASFLPVLRSSPEIKSRLGWAVYEPRGSGGWIQAYEHGLVVWTPHGLLYVLSNDGRWRTFPDASPL